MGALRPIPLAAPRRGPVPWASAALVLLAGRLCADDAPAPPRALFTVPLAAAPGEPVKVRARGLLLDGVSAARSATAGVTATLLSQGKAPLPNGVPAAKAGDTQVEVELRFDAALPAALPAAAVVLVAPGGETTFEVPLLPADRARAETEPNDGFATATPVALPPAGPLEILGQIGRPLDVDVHRIEVAAGTRLRVAARASALGSALDPLLTVHGADGGTLASADDGRESRDPVLELTVGRAETLSIVLQDANDSGGEAFPYRLEIEAIPAAPDPVGPSFVRDVAPILVGRCIACHGASRVEGGWRADSFDALRGAGASGAPGFVAGSRDASAALERIVSADPDLRMPLHGEPLGADAVAALRRWIDAGLPFDGTSSAGSLLEQIPAPVHPAAPAAYPAPPPVTALAFTPSGALLAGGWREVLVVDPASGSVVRRIGNVAERSSRIAVHPAGDRFAVAGGIPGRWGEVRVFALSGELLRVLAPGTDVVHDVAFSPAGDRLAVAASDATVRIHDASDGRLLRVLPAHRDWVLAVAWSPDGTRLATGSRDRTAKVFEAASGALLATYGRHDAPVRGILFAPGGEEMVSAGDSKKQDRWKIADAAHVRDTHLGGEVFQLAPAGDGFVAASAGGKVRSFRLGDGEPVREYDPAAPARFVSAAASPAADLVAGGTFDGRIVVWRLSTGERIAETPLEPGR